MVISEAKIICKIEEGEGLLHACISSLFILRVHRRRKNVGSIPAGGAKFRHVTCIISTRTKTHFLSEIKISYARYKLLPVLNFRN